MHASMPGNGQAPSFSLETPQTLKENVWADISDLGAATQLPASSPESLGATFKQILQPPNYFSHPLGGPIEAGNAMAGMLWRGRTCWGLYWRSLRGASLPSGDGAACTPAAMMLIAQPCNAPGDSSAAKLAVQLA